MKRDSDRLFDSMAVNTERVDYCVRNTDELRYKVKELQEKEDRNDDFMQDLLKRAEVLENQKVEQDVYRVEHEKIWRKFKELDTLNSENNVHYIQIENYLDKYLPIKQQKAIGRTLIQMFENSKGFIEKYADYEEKFLKEANRRILMDNGQPEVMRIMEREFV